MENGIKFKFWIASDYRPRNDAVSLIFTYYVIASVAKQSRNNNKLTISN